MEHQEGQSNEEEAPLNHHLTKRERKALKKQSKKEEKAKEFRAKKTKKMAIVSVILAILGIGIWFVSSAVQSNTPENQLVLNEQEWIKGDSDAKVTLTEYSDFQCPACALYSPIINQLAKDFGNDLRIEYKHFPLVTIHKNSLSAGQAALAAGAQDTFWEMHNMLFDRQPEWENSRNEKEKFMEYAKILELDMAKFEQDYNAKAIKDKINDDMREGGRLRINSTPTFFLNGQKIENPPGYSNFAKIIQDEIAKYKPAETANEDEPTNATSTLKDAGTDILK